MAEIWDLSLSSAFSLRAALVQHGAVLHLNLRHRAVPGHCIDGSGTSFAALEGRSRQGKGAEDGS